MWQQDYVYPRAMTPQSFGTEAAAAASDFSTKLSAPRLEVLKNALASGEKANDRAWQAQELVAKLEPQVMFDNLKLHTYDVPKALGEMRVAQEDRDFDYFNARLGAATEAANRASRENIEAANRNSREKIESKKDALTGRGLKQYEVEREDKIRAFSSPALVNGILDRLKFYGNDANVILQSAGLARPPKDGGGRESRLRGDTRITPEQAMILAQQLEKAMQVQQSSGFK